MIKRTRNKILLAITFLISTAYGLYKPNLEARPTYNDIHKITLVTWHNNKSITINNPEKIKKILTEINALNAEKVWQRSIGGKASHGSAFLSLYHYDKTDDKQAITHFLLESSFIVELDNGPAALRTHGYYRRFNKQDTPEIKALLAALAVED